MKEDLRIGLIAPLEISPWINPGCHIITAGARALLRRAFPLAKILPLEMMEERPKQWVTAKTCDVLILCGNPRFWLCEEGTWWDTGIWHRLLECQRHGVVVIDGWAGACYPLPLKHMGDMTFEIATLQRTLDLTPIVRQISHHISRDTLHQAVYAHMGVPTKELPCPSIWCHDYYNVPLQKNRTRRAMILHDIHRAPWLPDWIAYWSNLCTPITLSEHDYDQANRQGIASEYIYDPESLLMFLSHCDEVISFRVHGTVAAIAMDCAVAHIAMDSRSMMLKAYQLPTIELPLLEDKTPICMKGRIPDMGESIQVLRQMVGMN